jgi:hypothetical protein
MKKEGCKRKITFEKKNTGSHPGHGSTGFGRVITLAGLLINSDQSNHWIPGRPTGPVQV